MEEDEGWVVWSAWVKEGGFNGGIWLLCEDESAVDGERRRGNGEELGGRKVVTLMAVESEGVCCRKRWRRP